jgi:hypothetical protein
MALSLRQLATLSSTAARIYADLHTSSKPEENMPSLNNLSNYPRVMYQMNKICNPYHTLYCVSTLTNFPTAHPAGAFSRARFLVSVAAFHPFSSGAVQLAVLWFLLALHLLQTFQSQFGCDSSESITSGAQDHYTWSIRHTTSSCSCACNTRHGSKLPRLMARFQ